MLYLEPVAVALPLPDEVPLPQRKRRADRVEWALASGRVLDVPAHGGTCLQDGTPRTRDAYPIYQFIGHATPSGHGTRRPVALGPSERSTCRGAGHGWQGARTEGNCTRLIIVWAHVATPWHR